MTICEDIVKENACFAPLLADLGANVSGDGIRIRLLKNDALNGLHVKREKNLVSVEYSETAYMYRAIGLLVENEDNEAFDITEHPQFQSNGAMIDCSRNGVLSIPAAKSLIREMALMGHNTLMLYTEDTYQVDHNPYFGYMRGRYTREEIRGLDQYAKGYGIELIPCIQTLAHLQSALRWPCYRGLIDMGDTLLAEEPATYSLIEDMIRSCRESFTSEHIHIGMDEAFFIGKGNYLARHGTVPAFEILCRHLEKVLAICRKYGFSPMMWSDMFSHILDGSDHITDKIAKEKIDRVPPDVDLVYWDYRPREKAIYDSKIERHQQFPNTIVYAGGAWKWEGFAPSLFHSMKVSKLALKSCAEHEIHHVFITAWGDNGNECSTFAVLPVIQLFAEYNFHPDQDEKVFAKRLKICTGAGWDDFKKLDLLNFPCEKHDWEDANPNKYLLFQDVLLGLFDKHVSPGYPKYYSETSELLGKAAQNEPKYGYIFQTLSALCKALSLKCDVGIRLKKAYDERNMEMLRAIATQTLPEIKNRVLEFKSCLERQWHRENKSFGFEIQDIRIGGVVTRLDTAERRILDFVEGKVDHIDELEQERLYFDGRAEQGEHLVTSCNSWAQIVSACNM